MRTITCVRPRNAPRPRIRPTASHFGQRLLISRVLLILVLIALPLGLVCLNQSDAGERVATQDRAPAGGYTDFEGCIRIALQQSPYLIRSSVEIQLKQLDESDSRYGLIPSITFRTSFYPSQPKVPEVLGTPRSYGLNFYSEAYNPFESYFSLKIRKIVTQIAILGHLQVISDGLARLGRMFLELDILKRSAVFQDQLVGLAQQSLAYAENRQKLGTGTSLDVRVATQELEAAQIERQRMATSEARVLKNLRSFLGLKPDQGFTPDLREVRRQVLGQFNPAAVTMDQVQARSYDLKVQEYVRQLQTLNVTLAKTKLLPSLWLAVQTPDPVTLGSVSGLYFSIGLDVPIWDGFKRYRNISRQRAILRQYDTDKELKELDLKDRWEMAQENLSNTAVARKMARAQEELAQLRERQGTIRYQSGGEPVTVFLAGCKGFLDAQKNTLLRSLDYDLATLNLRQISGDLSYTYVNASSWQD
jgi:outer membrane protein TolC